MLANDRIITDNGMRDKKANRKTKMKINGRQNDKNEDK